MVFLKGIHSPYCWREFLLSAPSTAAFTDQAAVNWSRCHGSTSSTQMIQRRILINLLTSTDIWKEWLQWGVLKSICWSVKSYNYIATKASLNCYSSNGCEPGGWYSSQGVRLKERVPVEGEGEGKAREWVSDVDSDFRERAAIFDHTVRGALSPPHTSRAPGFAAQDHARARDSNAAQGNTQDMEATLANLLRKECQGCSEARRPSRPAPRIQCFGAIVTSQPWIQLTGGYARSTACTVCSNVPMIPILVTRIRIDSYYHTISFVSRPIHAFSQSHFVTFHTFS
jgi:hypothetical protein